MTAGGKRGWYTKTPGKASGFAGFAPPS